MYLSFADAVASNKFRGGARVWKLASSAVDQMGLDMTRRQLQANRVPAPSTPHVMHSDIGVSSRSSLYFLFVRSDFIARSFRLISLHVHRCRLVSLVRCFVFFFIDSSTFVLVYCRCRTSSHFAVKNCFYSLASFVRIYYRFCPSFVIFF